MSTAGLVSYQPPLVLTHEEWVNGGRQESHSARGRPTNPPRGNPARTTSRPNYRKSRSFGRLASPARSPFTP